MNSIPRIKRGLKVIQFYNSPISPRYSHSPLYSGAHLHCPLWAWHSRIGLRNPFGPWLGLSRGFLWCRAVNRFRCRVWSRVADNAPSFGTSMTPGRCSRKLLSKLFQRFPGSQGRRHMRPLYQAFLDRMLARSPAVLQQTDRHLKLDELIGKRGGYLCRTRQALELGNVEDWIDLGANRKLQLIRDLSHPMNDAEGPKKFEWQLLARAWSHRSLNVWL